MRKLAFLEIECIAQSAHEMNRAFNRLMGDSSYPAWHSAPEWMKGSAKTSVMLIAEHDTAPQQLHDLWVASKVADGWTLGSVKDFTNKIHPCLIPYDQLPEEHRIKDEMWISHVKIMLGAIWRIPQ